MSGLYFVPKTERGKKMAAGVSVAVFLAAIVYLAFFREEESSEALTSVPDLVLAPGLPRIATLSSAGKFLSVGEDRTIRISSNELHIEFEDRVPATYAISVNNETAALSPDRKSLIYRDFREGENELAIKPEGGTLRVFLEAE